MLDKNNVGGFFSGLNKKLVKFIVVKHDKMTSYFKYWSE